MTRREIEILPAQWIAETEGGPSMNAGPVSEPLGLEAMREALKLARNRIEYYGQISDRRHFDHDLKNVFPVIDASLQPPEAEIQSSDGEQETDDTRKGTAALLSPADADPTHWQAREAPVQVDRLAPSEANSTAAPVKHDINCGSCGKMFRDFAPEGAPTCDCGERAVRAMKEEMMRPAPVDAGVREALTECASRCRYDGDLLHDQGDIKRRDASWAAAQMAEDALAALSSQPVVGVDQK